MQTAIATQEAFSIDEAQIKSSFELTAEAITKIKAQAAELTIQGVEDKKGYKEVDEARKFVKKKISEVEKKRETLVKKAVSYQRAVNAEAKRLKLELEPIKLELEAKTDAIDAEKARIEAEIERQRQEKVANRIGELSKMEMVAVGATYWVGEQRITHQEVETLDDEIWSDFLNLCAKDFNARKEAERVAEAEKERLRLKAESEAKQIEAEKKAEAARVAAALEAEREALRIKAEAQEKELAELRAAQEAARIEAEKKEAELEAFRQKAAEQADKLERELEQDTKRLEVAVSQMEAKITNPAPEKPFKPVDMEVVLEMKSPEILVPAPQAATLRGMGRSAVIENIEEMTFTAKQVVKFGVYCSINKILTPNTDTLRMFVHEMFKVKQKIHDLLD